MGIANDVSTRARRVTIGDAAAATLLLDPNPARVGASFENTSTAILYLAVGSTLMDGTSNNVTITHDASASTNGVAVYAVADYFVNEPLSEVTATNGYYIGHLEFVSPTNADGSDVMASGPYVPIRDNDSAATPQDGLSGLVHAKAAAAGLEWVNAIAKPMLIPIFKDATRREAFAVTGAAQDWEKEHSFLFLNGVTSATAGGAQVYFDEDATAGSRFQATVVDNLNETADAYFFGIDVSSTNFSVSLNQNEYFELPYGFKGPVSGIWASDAGGVVCITEYV